MCSPACQSVPEFTRAQSWAGSCARTPEAGIPGIVRRESDPTARADATRAEPTSRADRAPQPARIDPTIRAYARRAWKRPILVSLIAGAIVATLVAHATSVDTVTGLYGPGIGMDSLNNTRVGGPYNVSTSYRFRAATSSKLNSVRVYVIDASHPGYGAGTGGTWEITIQTDDATAAHAPSGTVLARTTMEPTEAFPVIAWSAPASLIAGHLYHVVFENVDPDPAANYASVDGIFIYQPTSPRQPAFSDVDWGQPTRSGTGAWSDQMDTVPIMQLNYANGLTDGLGYMEVWVRSHKSISGDAKAREVFTVNGPSRVVGSVSVRLMRVSGSSPLTVRLETLERHAHRAGRDRRFSDLARDARHRRHSAIRHGRRTRSPRREAWPRAIVSAWSSRPRVTRSTRSSSFARDRPTSSARPPTSRMGGPSIRPDPPGVLSSRTELAPSTRLTCNSTSARSRGASRSRRRGQLLVEGDEAGQFQLPVPPLVGGEGGIGNGDLRRSAGSRSSMPRMAAAIAGRVGGIAYGAQRTRRVIKNDPTHGREVAGDDRHPGSDAFEQLVGRRKVVVQGRSLDEDSADVR